MLSKYELQNGVKTSINTCFFRETSCELKILFRLSRESYELCLLGISTNYNHASHLRNASAIRMGSRQVESKQKKAMNEV